VCAARPGMLPALLIHLVTEYPVFAQAPPWTKGLLAAAAAAAVLASQALGPVWQGAGAAACGSLSVPRAAGGAACRAQVRPGAQACTCASSSGACRAHRPRVSGTELKIRDLRQVVDCKLCTALRTHASPQSMQR